MFRRSAARSVALLASSCLFAVSSSNAKADVIANAGRGPASVEVLFNWNDGFVAQYNVSYGTSAADSIDVYDASRLTSAADPNLSLVWANFGSVADPNYFLNDTTYTGGHTSVGSFYSDSTPDNYWHEYYNDGSGWEFGNGASLDTVSNGEQIGWVFGSDAAPVPEPASATLICAGGALVLGRRRKRRGGVAIGAMIGGLSLVGAKSPSAADGASVVPGTLTQGSVKSSLGAGTQYAIETNNLSDWPLNTGGTAAKTFPINFENPDFNGNSFGGTANTIIAFGNGGGVTLHLATPISPKAGEKDLGIFTAQSILGGVGSFALNGNMDAAILVSADDQNWYTLTGTLITAPITYTSTTYSLNAPAMAYQYGSLATAWNYGSAGTSTANLAALTVANYTTPMPDDTLFNNPTATNAQRLALTTDASTDDYSKIFGASGGGNWFDISGSGLSQVDYIRLNGDANDLSTGGVRLDAVFANANAVPEPNCFAVCLATGLLVQRRTNKRVVGNW